MFRDLIGRYPRQAWLTALACGVGAMFGPAAMFAGTLPFFVGPIAHEFGWSVATVFGVFGVSAVAPLTLPMAGRLIDRWGVRAVVLPATIAYGLSLAALSLASGSKVQMAVLFVLAGVCGFVSAIVAFAKVITMWFDEHRGLMLAVIIGGAGALGPAVGIPLVQSCIDIFGWRAGYIAIGAAIVLVVFPLEALFLREPPRDAGANA